MIKRFVVVVGLAGLGFGGLCTGAVAQGAAPGKAPMAPAECLQLLDRLSAGIPRDETGPVLGSKGLVIRTPIMVPEGVVTNTKVNSAVRLRTQIDRRGRVIPGSVEVQQAEGDPALREAIAKLAESTLSFDVSRAFTTPQTFAFTTVYVSCARP